MHGHRVVQKLLDADKVQEISRRYLPLLAKLFFGLRMLAPNGKRALDAVLERVLAFENIPERVMALDLHTDAGNVCMPATSNSSTSENQTQTQTQARTQAQTQTQTQSQAQTQTQTQPYTSSQNCVDQMTKSQKQQKVVENLAKHMFPTTENDITIRTSSTPGMQKLAQEYVYTFHEHGPPEPLPLNCNLSNCNCNTNTVLLNLCLSTATSRTQTALSCLRYRLSCAGLKKASKFRVRICRGRMRTSG
jgi:hypothetical protein